VFLKCFELAVKYCSHAIKTKISITHLKAGYPVKTATN